VPLSVYALPVLFTLFVWWFSTGIILILSGLPRRTSRWIMLGATLILLGAFYGLSASRHDTSIGGAYCAFSCALLVWAWQEIGFLLGYVTGPRTTPCPNHVVGWRRAGFALQAILYHELALVVLACAVAAITWRGGNHVGTWTFMIFWAMRQSAKLNLFLGVRNLSEEFLPARLRYLETYFMRKPMNILWPVSVAASTVATWSIWQRALTTDAGAATGYTLMGALLVLGMVEHVFLVMPLPATTLWRWGLHPRDEKPGGQIP
jgi:putative photosynthetic complex assembly protein 2